MKKEYISYGLLGILGGLVIGFFIGNAVYPGTNAAPSNLTTGAGTESVNSGGPTSQNQQLPPNHPPIDSGQTIPAPPLSPGAGDNSVASNTADTSSGSAEGVALPSL